MTTTTPSLARRSFLATGALAVGAAATTASSPAQEATQAKPSPIVVPPAGKRILLGMIAKKEGGKDLTIAERL